jgi:hypothetical protein
VLCLHSVIVYGIVLNVSTWNSLTYVCVCFVSDIIVIHLVPRFVIGGSVARVETRYHSGASRDDRTSLGYTVYSVSKVTSPPPRP